SRPFRASLSSAQDHEHDISNAPLATPVYTVSNFNSLLAVRAAIHAEFGRQARDSLAAGGACLLSDPAPREQPGRAGRRGGDRRCADRPERRASR
ncbi:hypothetical protein, partial [Burkholderia pseudomallei]